MCDAGPDPISDGLGGLRTPNTSLLRIGARNATQVDVRKRVAGADALLESAPIGYDPTAWMTLRAVVAANGMIVAWLDERG